jgi:hypothetical protein
VVPLVRSSPFSTTGVDPQQPDLRDALVPGYDFYTATAMRPTTTGTGPAQPASSAHGRTTP